MSPQFVGSELESLEMPLHVGCQTFNMHAIVSNSNTCPHKVVIKIEARTYFQRHRMMIILDVLVEDTLGMICIAGTPSISCRIRSVARVAVNPYSCLRSKQGVLV